MRLVAAMVCLIALPVAVGAAPGLGDAGAAIDAAFRRGNAAYYRGDFPAAVAAFEQVVAQGVTHEDLFYNLGNAYYRAGQLGPAIYNYERALALDSDQEDARQNLQAARQAAAERGGDRVEGQVQDPFWLRAVTVFSRTMLLWLFLCAYYACFAALIVLRFMRPSLGRAAVATAAALLGVAVVVWGTLFFGRLAHDRVVRFTVVLPDEVAVRDGPGERASTAFRLHAGLRVRLVERDRQWLRIRLQNGLEGWLQERALGRL